MVSLWNSWSWARPKHGHQVSCHLVHFSGKGTASDCNLWRKEEGEVRGHAVCLWVRHSSSSHLPLSFAKRTSWLVPQVPTVLLHTTTCSSNRCRFNAIDSQYVFKGLQHWLLWCCGEKLTILIPAPSGRDSWIKECPDFGKSHSKDFPSQRQPYSWDCKGQCQLFCTPPSNPSC